MDSSVNRSGKNKMVHAESPTTEHSVTASLYEAAVKALAVYVAYCIVENANDNEDDPLTYSTDEEIVVLYATDIADGVSAMLPDLVKSFVPMPRP
jgi:hypothetical protein